MGAFVSLFQPSITSGRDMMDFPSAVLDSIPEGEYIYDLDSSSSAFDLKQFKVGENFWALGTENPTTGYKWNVSSDSLMGCGPEGSVTFTEESVDGKVKNEMTGMKREDGRMPGDDRSSLPPDSRGPSMGGSNMGGN